MKYLSAVTSRRYNFELLFDDDGGGGGGSSRTGGGEFGAGGDGTAGGEQGKGGQSSDDDKSKKKDADKLYTADDVDRIINERFARWEKQKAEDVKKAKESERRAGLSAEEKARLESEDLKREVEELKRANALAEMSKTARGIFKDAGILIGDNLLSSLVTLDADGTKANVDELSPCSMRQSMNA